jgi:RNA polymerase sigma-70 factor (ECF subfamily)
MVEDHTTVAVQRYLDQLAGDTTADPIVRDILARSARRLEILCGSLLRREYPRLMRPPMNLQQEELLSALVERLMRALRAVRPQSVRLFFSLANQHMRWELNDLARRLDDQPAAEQLPESAAAAPAPASTVTRAPSPRMVRMLQAIESLPEDEREVFDFVRVQGLTQVETSALLGVATKTVQRRLNRGLVLLTTHLRAPGTPPASSLPEPRQASGASGS